jgi:hypothetical protein
MLRHLRLLYSWYSSSRALVYHFYQELPTSTIIELGKTYIENAIFQIRLRLANIDRPPKRHKSIKLAVAPF